MIAAARRLAFDTIANRSGQKAPTLPTSPHKLPHPPPHLVHRSARHRAIRNLKHEQVMGASEPFCEPLTLRHRHPRPEHHVPGAKHAHPLVAHDGKAVLPKVAPPPGRVEGCHRRRHGSVRGIQHHPLHRGLGDAAYERRSPVLLLVWAWTSYHYRDRTHSRSSAVSTLECPALVRHKLRSDY